MCFSLKPSKDIKKKRKKVVEMVILMCHEVKHFNEQNKGMYI